MPNLDGLGYILGLGVGSFIGLILSLFVGAASFIIWGPVVALTVALVTMLLAIIAGLIFGHILEQ